MECAAHLLLLSLPRSNNSGEVGAHLNGVWTRPTRDREAIVSQLSYPVFRPVFFFQGLLVCLLHLEGRGYETPLQYMIFLGWARPTGTKRGNRRQLLDIGMSESKFLVPSSSLDPWIPNLESQGPSR